MQIWMMVFLLIAPMLPLASKQPDYSIHRQQMVEEQIYHKGITDKTILNAFLRVERHRFVKSSLWNKAYGNFTLPIDEGEEIQRPYHVAIMTLVIQPAYDKKVLEIGTGSGYHAAILAELVKEVYTIEISEKLARQAQKRLKSLNYKNINFKIGDGYVGWEKHAPYDGIIVTCSPDHIPAPLINQLAINGRMVIPVSYSSKVQELILIEKDLNGNLKKTNLIPVEFRPLIRGSSER